MGCQIGYLPSLGGLGAGWGDPHRRGGPAETSVAQGPSKILVSADCTVWPIPRSNHGESEERQGMPAFCSFFLLSPQQTQVRLLFRPLLAQLQPPGLQRACFSPSREFLSSSGSWAKCPLSAKDGSQPMDGAAPGSKYRHLANKLKKKKEFTYFIYIFDSGISGMKLYPGGTGQGTGQPTGWNTGSPEGGRFPRLHPQGLCPTFP